MNFEFQETKREIKIELEAQKIKREIEIEGFHSIYYFEFDKDFTHTPERHDFWEMTYVDSGSINAVTEGLGRTVSQGQILFNKPNELHAHISDKKVANNMLIITFTTKSAAMDFFDGKMFTLDKTQKTLISLFMNEAKIALGKIPSEYADKSPLNFNSAPPGSVQLLDCYLTELLLVLKRSNSDDMGRVMRTESTRELGQSSIAAMLVGYLKENVCSPLSIKDMCQKFYMGKTQLYKIFTEYMGEGPIEYLTKLKMKEAKRLLREEKTSVSKIADVLCYSSIHNFSRSFKKAVGISPTEYKKRLNHEE